MSWYVFFGLAVVNTSTMAGVNFADARYNHALAECRAGNRVEHRAARWATATWIPAFICFAVAVKISLWLAPFEGVGLYLGSYLGARSSRPR